MSHIAEFTLDDYLNLVLRQRRWLELLLAARHARSELPSADARDLADEAVSVLFALRATQLRN
jgi:hypothetical protein